MKLIIVLLGLVALADVVVSIYPNCCPDGKDTWCFTCSAPMDDCCISIGMPQKCNVGETCGHSTDAKGHSHRGCVPISSCPNPPVICGENEKSCKECQCDDPKFHTDVQDRNVSQCEDPGYEYPHCIAWCYGDPHIGTCDKRKYSLNAVDCCHIFIRDECVNGLPNGPPTFEVSVYLDHAAVLKRGQIAKAAKIIYRNINLYVNPNIGTYEENGVTVSTTAFPSRRWIGTSVTETFFSSLSILCFEFVNDGFRVYWDYRGGMSVWIPNNPQFKGHMCGLAGDCDGNPLNDLIYGPSVDVGGQCPDLAPSTLPQYQPGSVAILAQMKKFGMSWFNHNTGSPACDAVCNQGSPIMM